MPRKAHRRQKSQQHDAQQHDVQQQQQGDNYDHNGSSAENQHLPDVQAATESIDDMNLRVLQRYEPTIRSIEAVAASSVVYAFNRESGGWIKADPQIEGTLFLCEHEPLQLETIVVPRASVFVLNRKGLMNVVVDLGRVSAVEVREGLITLAIEDRAAAPAGPDGTGAPQVLGLWVHGNGTTGSGSGTNGPLFDPNAVLRRWQAVQSATELVLGSSQIAETSEFLDTAAMISRVQMSQKNLNPDGIATTAIGPQPSVNEILAMVLGQATGHGVAQEGP